VLRVTGLLGGPLRQLPPFRHQELVAKLWVRSNYPKNDLLSSIKIVKERRQEKIIRLSDFHTVLRIQPH